MTGLSNLSKQQMPLVPVALIAVERPGGDPVPPLVLPPVEPSDHRGHLGVAEVPERLCGQS